MMCSGHVSYSIRLGGLYILYEGIHFCCRCRVYNDGIGPVKRGVGLEDLEIGVPGGERSTPVWLSVKGLLC